MGLDMYLESEAYVSKYFGPDASEEQRVARLGTVLELCDELHLPVEDRELGGISICTHAGYWRKANAIHAWFVRECQNGVDECQRTYVELDKLEELREACTKIIESAKVNDAEPTHVGDIWHKGEDGEVVHTPVVEGVQHLLDTSLAEELLPTQGGFFFGGTGYDVYYLADLERTVAIIDRCKAAHEADPTISFYYRSSW